MAVEVLPSHRQKPLLSTEQVDITDQSVIYAHAADGDYLRAFPTSDHSNDLGAAFNAAYSTLRDNVGYGTVILPPTDENYSTMMVMDSTRIDVRGSGMWATAPVYTGSDAALFVDGARWFTIQDLGIRGDGTAEQDGIHLDTANNKIFHYAIRNISIENVGRYGIIETVGNGNDLYDQLYDTIYIQSTGDHAYYSATPYPEGGSASKTLFNVQAMIGGIGGDFIHDTGAGLHRRYISCEAEGSVSGDGFHIFGDQNTQIFGCRAEGVGGDGFFLRGTNVATIENCIAYNCGGNGFHAYGDLQNTWWNGIYETGSGNQGFLAGGAGTVEHNYLGPSYDFESGTQSLTRFTGDMKRGRMRTRVSVSSNTSINPSTTKFVGVDSADGAVTITLPDPGYQDSGQHVTILDEGGNASANNITVDIENNITIYGISTISTDYGSIRYVCDGTSYFGV